MGSLVNLTGYTSTSKDFRTALGFAIEGDLDTDIPVVLEISFFETTGFVELKADYSAYPYEQEVLVQDGLQYLITANTEEENE